MSTGEHAQAVYWRPEPPEYPHHDRTILITKCGRICIGRRKINLSTVFADQYVGIREVTDKIWLVSFMDYDLGYFDEQDRRVEPAENPFIPILLPMCPVWTLTMEGICSILTSKIT